MRGGSALAASSLRYRTSNLASCDRSIMTRVYALDDKKRSPVTWALPFEVAGRTSFCVSSATGGRSLPSGKSLSSDFAAAAGDVGTIDGLATSLFWTRTGRGADTVQPYCSSANDARINNPGALLFHASINRSQSGACRRRKSAQHEEIAMFSSPLIFWP